MIEFKYLVGTQDSISFKKNAAGSHIATVEYSKTPRNTINGDFET